MFTRSCQKAFCLGAALLAASVLIGCGGKSGNGSGSGSKEAGKDNAPVRLGTPASEAVNQNIFVEPVEGITDDFIRGVDISSLYDIEKAGGKYYNDQGEEEDLFKILKDHGVNWVRLRLWNNPTYAEDLTTAGGKVLAKKGDAYGGGNNSLAVDLELAKRAKAQGLKFLLDFHYSDTWADPAKQYMPQDWVGLDEDQLNAAVEEFTRTSIEAFINEGAAPDMVQIGNELNNGFMWPIGKIWSSDGTEVGGMKSFIRLLKSASKGVRNAQALSSTNEKIKIMVHLADGGDTLLYHSVFNPIQDSDLDYDVIGLSFYTYWHGSPEDLKANLKDLAKNYGKEMIVVETAYGFTKDDGDKTGNVFKVYSDTSHGYIPSVQGQATAVRDIINAVASVELGKGVFYWEPAWIPVEGAGLSATEGDTWENQGMFDFEGRALPSLAVWNLVGGKGEVKNKWGGSARKASEGEVVPYAISEPIKITTEPTVEPEMPYAIKLVYTNDAEKRIGVTWDEHDWSKETKKNVVKIEGHVKNTNFKPTATVTVTTQINQIEDYSWESGNLGNWTLEGENGTACYVENNKGNAHTGSWTYKYWLGTPFTSDLTQTITGLDNSTYDLSIWAMGGGGENEIRFYAKNYGAGEDQEISAQITNVGWQEWKQYRLTVPVTNGQLTVGIHLDTNAGCWGNFDDVVLINTAQE